MNQIVDFSKGIMTGQGAVVTAGVVNSTVLSKFGLFAAVCLSAPLVEEVTKTGYALLFEGDVVTSHVMFGSTEGLIYGEQSGQVQSFDYRRPLIHAAFGTIYLSVSQATKNPAMGILAAVATHFGWNLKAYLDSIKGGVQAQSTVFLGEEEKEHIAETWADVKNKLLI